MNSSASVLNSPTHQISENGQYYINGTMLGVLCLMAICAIALFCYYIAWAMRNANELENIGNQALASGATLSASSSATIVHLPVFPPHAHSFRVPIPACGRVSNGSQCKLQGSNQSRSSSPPPSYESIFPCEHVITHTPL